MNIQEDVPFASLTTLRIGGSVKYFAKAESVGEIIQLIETALGKGLPYLVVGSGSNLLVSDEGFIGMVIQNAIRGIKKSGDAIECSSGVALQELVDFANQNGVAGFEKLAGIPGTAGGAVYGNAGAYGQTISDNIIHVEILRDKDIKILSREECGFGYRDSGFKRTHDIILKVGFLASKGDAFRLRETSAETIKTREQKYYPSILCPGSFFKNLETDRLSQEVLSKIPRDKIMFGKIPAGWLLEEVGAKGAKRGGVEIAAWHANLFMNTGGGTAEDFISLAKEYKDKVKQKFGITLEPEVQLIGFERNPLE